MDEARGKRATSLVQKRERGSAGAGGKRKGGVWGKNHSLAEAQEERGGFGRVFTFERTPRGAPPRKVF